MNRWEPWILGAAAIVAVVAGFAIGFLLMDRPPREIIIHIIQDTPTK